MPPRFAELLGRSCFSFLEGASRPVEMVEQSQAVGQTALGLCDRDGLYGSVRAHVAAGNLDHPVVVGAELTLELATLDGESEERDYVERPCPSVSLLVQTHRGYRALCRLLTASHADHDKGEAGITAAEIAADCDDLFAVVPLEARCPLPDADLAILREAFGERIAIGLWRHLGPEDRLRRMLARRASERHDIPLVATNRPLYHHRRRKPLSDVLHCIRYGTTLEEAGTRLTPNAEASLKGPKAMAKLFADEPEWLERSAAIAERCRFSLGELRYHFPNDYGEPGLNPDENLRRAVEIGIVDRFGDHCPPDVRAQLEKELALIAELEVASYFLSVQQIVKIARERQILCQGRGSAANSAVCYVLGVTSVDPVRSNLLFERFMSSARREPPDIDVDFEHERREEVIQEIYRRYGRDRAAMVSEVICYRGKSALREVGKVFGLSGDQLDRLSSIASYWSAEAEVNDRALTKRGLDPNDDGLKRAVALARELSGFPRHLSIHVGGFVLSSEPLDGVSPIEPARMEDRTVIPWDKDDVEDLGFFKVDVLGLGMLTAIRKALGMIHQRKHGSLDDFDPIASLGRIPPEDPAVYDACCAADTLGVFQIESRAQMAMLPILRPRCFYDLVVEVGIVRPGPIQGKMVHPYLRRRTGEEEVTFPHPCLEPILSRTLGVPLFQEQVMQLAITGAGYDPGEADQLRRDMAAWRKNGRLELHKDKLLRGFLERGISVDFAKRLFMQIRGFGEYGFPECVVGQTLIIDADTGRRVPIEDIVSGRTKVRRTVSCDHRFRLKNRRISKAIPSGEKYVYRLRTALGRELTATAEHPLLTIDGWRKLGELTEGDHVAVARKLPKLGTPRAITSSSSASGPGECTSLGEMHSKVTFPEEGSSDIDWDRIASIEPLGMRSTYDLSIEGDDDAPADEREMQHNFLANDFVVHNSHSSSFALLVYASVWLKVYYPAAFAAALVNSQPMGFYTPGSIIRDAQKHGVEVRPIRVEISDWDCTLEGEGESATPSDGTGGPAIRLGLRLVRGFGEEAADRLIRARHERPFDGLDDVVKRAALKKNELEALAEAGAFEGLTPSRREALWRLRAPREDGGLFYGLDIEPNEPAGLPPMSAQEQLSLDYGTTGISLSDHPMKHLRKRLRKRRVKYADEQKTWTTGQQVTVAGVVLTRQRPGTASGVVFITLEDETGTVNLVLYSHVFERYELVARHSGMLLARGRIDRRGDVVHVRVSHLERLDMPKGQPLTVRSRDFH